MDIPEILASPIFLTVVIPLINVVLTIFFKHVSKRDVNQKLAPEDFMISVDIFAAALFIFLIEARGLYNYDLETLSPAMLTSIETRMEMLPWLLCANLILLFMMTTFTRVFGWKKGGNRPRLIAGVFVPDILSIVWYIFIMQWWYSV